MVYIRNLENEVISSLYLHLLPVNREDSDQYFEMFSKLFTELFLHTLMAKGKYYY